MKTNKAIEIYLPNNTDSLNKDLLEKQRAITKILKGTPFEKDTYAIFEHLRKIQVAIHKTESDIASRKKHLKEDLDVIKTLLALHTIPEKIELLCGSSSKVDLPQRIVRNIALQIKSAAIALFNQSPHLFCGKDGIILNPTNKKHLETKKIELENQIIDINTIKEKSGRATYTKETPNKTTDTFRMLCAIKVFCKCDGFEEWEYRGGKTDRNKCIFECLQVFGYATIKDTKDEDDNEKQRQYIKERVRQAEESNIDFIIPPL